jgi:hypothetical protein
MLHSQVAGEEDFANLLASRDGRFPESVHMHLIGDHSVTPVLKAIVHHSN